MKIPWILWCQNWNEITAQAALWKQAGPGLRKTRTPFNFTFASTIPKDSLGGNNPQASALPGRVTAAPLGIGVVFSYTPSRAPGCFTYR